MTVHVTLSYAGCANPIASTEGAEAMASFLKFMEHQSQFPGLKPIFVGWKDQRPPAGFGFFECVDVAQVATFMDLMPGGPAIDITEVFGMDVMAKRAVSHLAKA